MTQTFAQLLPRQMTNPSEMSLFAVLDGASVPNLPQELYKHEPDYLCLYRGALEPDLAETAPYLVRMEPGTPFTDWVFDHGWGNHWGIFVASTSDIRDLRAHFRRYLLVYDPTGKPLYFRYYDPRVLRTFLPTCTAAELAALFGPISYFFAEDEDPGRCIKLRIGHQVLVSEFVALDGMQSAERKLARSSR